jgi:uncharacterized protein YggU (UPF0235/DUF167 family)
LVFTLTLREFAIETNRYIAKVKAPADKNKANKAVLKLASEYFNKKAMIKSGMASKEKLIILLD